LATGGKGFIMKMTIADMMKKRSPLTRQSVSPVDFYAVPEKKRQNVPRPERVNEPRPKKPLTHIPVTDAKILNGKRLISTGKLAKKTGETLRTLRFWIEEGLLRPAALTKGTKPGRYQHYKFMNDAIIKIGEIRRLQKTKGLTIAQMKRYYARRK